MGWTTQIFLGAWKPDRGWIDRSGRVLGVVAIVVSLVIALGL
jgi:hypothetical protein